jgi:WD40 repeat protein
MFSSAFSTNGQLLATTHGQILRVWDVPSRGLRVERTNFNFLILGLAFSPDGKTVVTAGGTMYVDEKSGGNGEVRLWDAATGEELPTRLSGIKSCAYNAIFSRDGQVIAASGAGDGVVGLWHVGTGEMVGRLPGHNGFVWGLGFSHDGRLLATADERGYVWLWDWAASQIKAIFHPHDAPIYVVAFSPDDTRLVTASRDRTAKLWDCQTRKELTRFAGHEGGVTDVKFFPDGQTVVTSSQDSNLKFWNAQTGGNIQLAKDASAGQTILFSPDDRFLMRLDSSSNQVAFLDPGTGNSLTNLPAQNVAASPDGTLVLLRGSKVVFLDPSTLKVTAIVDCGAGIGSQPGFSPDGKWLAFRRGDREPTQIVILDVRQKLEFKVLSTTNSGWAPLYFARAGTLLVTANWGDESVSVWDTASWRQVTNYPAMPGVFGSRGTDVQIPMAVSPDGKTLACGAGEASVRLWDLDCLEEVPALRSGAGTVFSIAFSPDGKTLALGALDRTVKLWNLAARQEVTSLVGHSSYVWGLAFSADGRILASTSLDTSLRLWSAPSWQEIERSKRSQ